MTHTLTTVAVLAAFLVLTSQLAERDRRLADQERAQACRPIKPGDTTTYTNTRGRLECARTTRQAGRRVVAYRSLSDD